MDTEQFLATAGELLAVQSTADRPDELRRALDFVLDFVGPGFTVERFESGGKPSALLYPGDAPAAFPGHPQRPPGRGAGPAGPVPRRAATATACTRGAPRT